jgi:ribosome maturation protein SDO1
MSKSITVKYKGLEILCKPGTIVPYRHGKLPFNQVVITDDAIYKDIKQGNVASEKDLVKAFGENLELKDAIEIMLQKGDFQMTTKERQELMQQRRLKLIDHFHHNYVNPETNQPHPINRIDNVFNQIKARVNYEISFDKNCEEIRKGMLGVLPIKPKTVDTGAVFQPTNKSKQNTNTSTLNANRRKGGKRFGK